MRRVILFAVCIVALGAAQEAFAGVFTDDLSKCLVNESSPADRTLLMQWMFAVLSRGSAVKPLSALSPEQRTAFDKKGATLMERLMLKDCRAQTIAAIRNEGSGSVEGGFRTLGQVAARDLMTDPQVASSMKDLSNYLDKPSWEALAKEATAAGAQ